MKKSICDEIKALRKTDSFCVDNTNGNRYMLVLFEEDGSRTAYCFSTPIYNINTGKMVKLCFHKNKDTYLLEGSNADVRINDEITLKNSVGSCRFIIPQGKFAMSDPGLKKGNDYIYPATNGIAYKASCRDGCFRDFSIITDVHFMNSKDNNKYFVLMTQEYEPFVTVSAIGCMNKENKIVSPAVIEAKKTSDLEYRLSLVSCCSDAEYILFEINLYERKLFLDTTVESKNIGVNNAFGSIAFVGDTEQFGEQWLYSRPAFSLISELYEKSLNYAVLHIPKYSDSDIELNVSKAGSRFCSFGSTWSNKIPVADFITKTVKHMGYLDIDISGLLIDPQKKRLMQDNGFVINTPVRNHFSVLSTGDNYYFPQILEINYE